MNCATVPLLADVPGLVHGFERRSAATAPQSRDETRRRVASALAPRGVLHLLHQVHGRTVREAPWQGRPEGDAGWTGASGVILGVETADCLPVLLVDPARRLVAAAHAGWRGTAQGVVSASVGALVRAGSRPEELLAALGPGIGACCYEVGDELRAAFDESARDLFRPGPQGRPHLDLRELNRRQLVAAGLRASRVASLDECTRCRPDLYFSYRRDGRAAGRMLSFVGFERPAR